MYLTFTDSENMGNKLSLLDDYSMHLAQLQIRSLQISKLKYWLSIIYHRLRRHMGTNFRF